MLVVGTPKLTSRRYDLTVLAGVGNWASLSVLLPGMSRGIGKTQQRILDELAAATDRSAVYNCLSVAELADRIGSSDRQIRFVLQSLEQRGLVVITAQIASAAVDDETRPEELREDAGYYADTVEEFLLDLPEDVKAEHPALVCMAQYAATLVDNEEFSSDFRLDALDALKTILGALNPCTGDDDDAESEVEPYPSTKVAR